MTRGSMRADVRCDPPADRPGHNEDAGNHTGRHYVDDADVLASSHAPQRRGEESMTASKTTRRRRRSTGIAAGAALLAGTALAAAREPPIVLAEMGSFHVGGRLVEIAGKPVREVVFTPGGVPAKVDPNGAYMAEQMYVQYFIPQDKRGALPLLMWHGGGLTGVTYETTPDGREGWLNYFIRRGWSVYNSDPFERFRIGAGEGAWSSDPAKRKVLPGVQFPVDDGYLNFVKQVVPRWTT